MSDPPASRDELLSAYLDTLPYDPYPLQEEALLAWFTANQGVLVCAPTGTGKTLIAEAAMFEALKTGKRAYYTTPLIALTEQKYQEMREAAVRWGFREDDVGLVTGNRRENPEATVLVVVAEILLNRLLHPEQFQFDEVSAVVMDEFHSFGDPERGIVWELSLSMLPPQVRTLLLSATVGNATDFVVWLNRQHGRALRLIQGTERKVVLQYHWVEDQLLNELLQELAEGNETTRKTPALVFCFNRDACWDVAEQLKGRDVVNREQQKRLAAELDGFDWSAGAGPKLKQILMRGVGVHHAGLLPKYRRIVEQLFQKKLLSVAVCTETLSAGINLPARSVVLTSLLKGPPGNKKLIDASTAHQIFGRAGRPQFDTEGHIYAIAHEDDVKILKWKEKYDVIPEDTKDPNLLKALKRIRKKMPTRRKTEQYWNQEQFQKLIAAPPGKLASRGSLPWRLLAYLLHVSPDVSRLRTVVDKRLMEPKQLETGHRALNQMLMSLWAGGFAKLEPPPPSQAIGKNVEPGHGAATTGVSPQENTTNNTMGTLGALIAAARKEQQPSRDKPPRTGTTKDQSFGDGDELAYEPTQAIPTSRMQELLAFRSVNPIYATFLVQQLGIADLHETIQALESVLEIPGSVARLVRVPRESELPQGRLAIERLNQELLERGLATAAELSEAANQEADMDPEDRIWVLRLGDKLKRLFDAEFPGVHDIRTRPVWVVGDVLQFNGDFNAYITARKLAKQEGILFRHLLRFILLCGEFRQVTPPDADPVEWDTALRDLAERVTQCCRQVDPISTDDLFAAAFAQDLFVAEALDQPAGLSPKESAK